MELLFGREGEIRRIFELLNGGSSVAIIGDEGIGKTSLLWAIYKQGESRLQLPRQPVFLDLNCVHNENEIIQLIQESGGHPKKLMQMCHETYSKYSNSRDGG